MFAGFGTAEETNARFKYLLDQGQTGLSIAFDLATLMGYDTDQPEALGEFGKCGVAVSSLKDMEILLDGIPLDKVSTSMTINSPAAIIWAMYIATAENRGIRTDQLRGTTQNDILKEFIAQKEYIFPPEPSMRLVVDTMEFGARESAAMEYDFAFPGITSVRRARLLRRNWPSRSATGWSMCVGALPAAWTWMQFAPRFPSSSTLIMTFSKRSPNTEPHADLGT